MGGLTHDVLQRCSANQSDIWAAKRRYNFTVTYKFIEQFTIIWLMIRPSLEKMNTKSLISDLVVVSDKMMKKLPFYRHPLKTQISVEYRVQN